MIGFFCVAPEFPDRGGRLVTEFTKKENDKYGKAVARAVEQVRILHMRIDARWRGTKTWIPTTVGGEGVPTYLISQIGYGARGYTKNPLFDISGPCTEDGEDREIEAVAEALFTYYANLPVAPVIVVMRDEHALRRLIMHLTHGNCPATKWDKDTVVATNFSDMHLAFDCEIVP